VWWLWVLGGLVGWLVVAVAVGLILGRVIRVADERAPRTGPIGVVASADLPAGLAPQPVAPARVRRRAIPLPPIGIALAALGVALMTAGYVLRLTGSTGTTANLLSMDAPYSLPRMFVALLFAAAGLAAVAGAGSIPGRRTWWVAVGLVAGGVAAVKAGSTVHSDALHALEGAIGGGAAVVASGAMAAAVVGALWFLSRNERRDRRRVLSVLALYAVAAVGLSALSSVTAGAYGEVSNVAIAATFVEESGEALAAVAFLIAVLAGVAPRLVLPAAWQLRRAADAHTLEVPEALPGRTVTDGTTSY
jgi:hypothetical protein